MSALIGWAVGLGVLTLSLIFVVYFVLSLFLIIPTWRICRRAGFSGAVSLFHLIPGIGLFIVLAVLAFSTWPAGEARRS
jgi:hypothetical protein